MRHQLKGIVFDMDNTILSSKIDFQAMKYETYHFLVSKEILPAGYNLDYHTTSTIVEEAIQTNRMTEELLNEMWDIAKKHEVCGMQGADLEPGAVEILNKLQGRYHLAIVTNNSVEAAEIALRDNGIYEYFDFIIGRELMKSLKPSPDGYLRVLDEFKNSANEWLSIGDSWIDGKASISAGIRFIAYRSDKEMLKQMKVNPTAELSDLLELMSLIEQIEEGSV
ncbi:MULTISPECIES: HAD family hydrolase [Paenibacillus]|uniref:HAD family hydrolase n=1 Tax=Paenibacillus alvei TaxID=44250 RepID=A0ABT4EC62_PAEAL|nr:MULTISPECIES: HAD-IA family hydrolase [Paenibacillus]MCY9531330.1 HAD family hydrolase [Paenibacillus alvei]SDE95690.1 phosphoglycolate phosphatase [Paenibacillus sp. cl6col]